MNKYYKEKARIRQFAIEWQNTFDENSYSYGELAKCQDYFYKKAKRYGLIKEFRENAII